MTAIIGTGKTCLPCGIGEKIQDDMQGLSNPVAKIDKRPHDGKAQYLFAGRRIKGPCDRYARRKDIPELLSSYRGKALRDIPGDLE